jgi:hypothetical protein
MARPLARGALGCVHAYSISRHRNRPRGQFQAHVLGIGVKRGGRRGIWLSALSSQLSALSSQLSALSSQLSAVGRQQVRAVPHPYANGAPHRSPGLPRSAGATLGPISPSPRSAGERLGEGSGSRHWPLVPRHSHEYRTRAAEAETGDALLPLLRPDAGSHNPAQGESVRGRSPGYSSVNHSSAERLTLITEHTPPRPKQGTLPRLVIR